MQKEKGLQETNADLFLSINRTNLKCYLKEFNQIEERILLCFMLFKSDFCIQIAIFSACENLFFTETSFQK